MDSVSLINGHIDRGSMTPQEALSIVEGYEKALREDQEYLNNGDEFHVEALRVCEVVKQALEKQIPKKPIENRYPWAICPVCNGSIYLKNVQEYIQNKENTFCEHCGQALDWSGAE